MTAYAYRPHSTQGGRSCPRQSTICACSTTDDQHLAELLRAGFTADTAVFLSDLHAASRCRAQAAFLSFDAKRRTPSVRSVHLGKMAAYLAAEGDAARDTYVSLQRFAGPRKSENLLELSCLALDLDYYAEDSQWRSRVGEDPQRVVDSFLALCDMEGIPQPSLVTHAHGLQAVWLFDRPVPAKAQVRWKLAQKELIGRFADYGADPKCSDVSRVFRLPGTRNSKNGQLCRIVHRTTDAAGMVVRYNFEYLAEMLLPHARWECERHKKERAAQQQRRLSRPQLHRTIRGTETTRRTAYFTYVARDLAKLIELRGGMPVGMRMRMLFSLAVSHLHAGLVGIDELPERAKIWAKRIDPEWQPQETALKTVIEKAQRARQGETVIYGSQSWSPLYTPKRQTVIETFAISPEEQQQLTTLRCADLSGQERHNALRRVHPDRPQARISAERTERAERARALRSEGKTIADIAAALGVSASTVHRYLKTESSTPETELQPPQPSKTVEVGASGFSRIADPALDYGEASPRDGGSGRSPQHSGHIFSSGPRRSGAPGNTFPRPRPPAVLVPDRELLTVGPEGAFADFIPGSRGYLQVQFWQKRRRWPTAEELDALVEALGVPSTSG